jgi:hypothetical protein
MNPLYQAVLSDASFLDLLYAFDLDLAAKAQAERCPVCGGALHWASYWRKPRGVLAAACAEFCRRFSFCCAVRDCRKRLTPPSLRFLGPKVYLAIAVILLTAMRQRATGDRQPPPADRRTLGRWRRWWRTTFAEGAFWRAAKAAFMPPADAADLPAVLLDRFIGGAKQKILALLKFLAPITGGASAMRAF